MIKEQAMVNEFHKAFGSELSDEPREISEAEAALRVHLMEEELREVITAMAFEDLPAIAKELADLLYVVYGAASSYGFDMEPIFKAVHESNMSKMPTDGVVKYREDGKVVKPETYSPPDLKPIIEKQKEYTGDGERKDNWYDYGNLGQGVPFGAPEPASDGEGIV
jgi:predicted HAD superfamily Cof-like phosphohydrolase